MIRSRRGFQAPRALLGGLLVATAAVMVFAAALSAAGGGRSGYAVAARPLPAGSVIGPGDLTTARMGLPAPVAAGAYRRPDALIGHTLAVTVQPGQLVETSMLGDSPPARLRPVSIPVDTDSLAALDPGQTVDVLAVPAASSSAPQTPTVSVVMRGATLEAVARAGGGILSGSTGATTVVTLGVADLHEAELLVQAAHSATVELVRAVPADGSGTGPGGGAPADAAAYPGGS